jgi:hypothetical protein
MHTLSLLLFLALLSTTLFCFTASHFRRHSTSPNAFAFAFVFIFTFSSAASNRIISIHRIALPETQHVTIPICFCLSSAAFDNIIAFHRIAFPGDTEHHASTLYPILLSVFLALLSAALFTLLFGCTVESA